MQMRLAMHIFRKKPHSTRFAPSLRSVLFAKWLWRSWSRNGFGRSIGPDMMVGKKATYVPKLMKLRSG